MKILAVSLYQLPIDFDLVYGLEPQRGSIFIAQGVSPALKISKI